MVFFNWFISKQLLYLIRVLVDVHTKVWVIDSERHLFLRLASAFDENALSGCHFGRYLPCRGVDEPCVLALCRIPTALAVGGG